MENIRCLIADIPHTVLADILQQITESRIGVEVMGRVNNSDEMLRLIAECNIDVVLLGMKDKLELLFLDKIFSQHRDIIVVGIFEDGRRICLCMDDVSPDLLTDLISIKGRFNR